MNEDELHPMLERPQVYLITSLHTWGILLALTAVPYLKVTKLHEKMPEAEETRWCTIKQTIRLFFFQFSADVFLFHWAQKWLFL